MRGVRWLVLPLAVVVTAVALLAAGSKPDPRAEIRHELPGLLPPGANLYLGFADLRGDLDRLGSSGWWSAFGGGENHEAFIRSRLWLRFEDRLTQLEMVAGAPLDGPALRRLAAGTCALAFYAVGDIEFVYVAREDLETELLVALGEMEGDFQTVRHGDATYRLIRDAGRDLELVWATAGGYLVVSDRERLVHVTLDRIAGRGASLADDPGFRDAVDALPTDGDQVVYLNLAGLRDDGYFRRYWMQKDRALLEAHQAFAATAVWRPDRIAEHRILAREVAGAPDAPAAPDPTAAFELLPADALAAKAFSAADPAEVAAVFLNGGRSGEEPLDGFRTPLHDLLAAGDLSREQFDALVGDRFAVGVLSRPYDDTFTVLDRVVITRPADPDAARAAYEQVVAALPRRVTERLAGDVQRPFPTRTDRIGDVDVWSFDLYTRGVYAPALAWVDGWLVMGNTVDGPRAVIEAAGGHRSLATLPEARRAVRDAQHGPLRQVLYLDLDRSRTAYETVIGAMERGDTFRSWDAHQFWGERVRDLLYVLEPVEGVTSWSTETERGLEGETVYLLGG